jgi:hypothetical protein
LLQAIAYQIRGARSRGYDLGRRDRFPIQGYGSPPSRIASLSSYPLSGAGNSLVD